MLMEYGSGRLRAFSALMTQSQLIYLPKTGQKAYACLCETFIRPSKPDAIG
jgi:hypothetical protein